MEMIGSGKMQVFLVYDSSLGKLDAPFFQKLRGEGFRLGDPHGNFGCPWAYADVTRKLYAYGMLGIKMADVIGKHAVTQEEFWTIYEIFKKYEGMPPLEFGPYEPVQVPLHPAAKRGIMTKNGEEG